MIQYEQLLELLVLGKSKEALLTLPLKAIDGKQETPIDMTAEEGSTGGNNTNEHIQDVNQGGRDTEMRFESSDDEEAEGD